MSSTRARSAATDDAENGGQMDELSGTAQTASALPADDATPLEGDEEDDQEGSGESSSATASRNRSRKRGGSRKRGRLSAVPSRSRQSKASQSVEADGEEGQPEDGESEQDVQRKVVKEEDDADEGAVDEEDSTDTAEHEKRARRRSVSGLKELAGLGLQTLGDGADGPLMPRRSRRSGNGSNEGGRRGTKEEEDGEEGASALIEDDQVEPVSDAMPLEEKDVKEVVDAVVDDATLKATEAVLTGEDEEGGDEGVTRCLCGSADENVGLMIQCETCKCWQHCICMGMRTEEDCPDVYFCEQCRPELHVPLLRLLGVLPARGAKKGGSKLHGGKGFTKDSAKELKEAKEAVLTLAKENERRRQEGRQPVTGWSVAQEQEQESGANGEPLNQEELEHQQQLVGPGQMPGRGSSSSVTPHRRHPNETNRMQRSNSRDDIPVPKSPPKRRSTMNSRDSVYGWEPIPPGLLNEDEVWSEEGKDDKEDGSRKRKRLGREDENGAASFTANSSNTDAVQKRRRTSPGVDTIEEEAGVGEQEGEEDIGASQPSQRSLSQRGGGRGRESERPRHPNQYTKRAAAAAGGVNGDNTSPGPSPHKSRVDGMRRSTRETAAGSRTGTPAPGEHLGRRGDGTWGLPDHLSHLAFLLPPGVGPEPLKVSMPTAKSGPKGGSSSMSGVSGAVRDTKTDRIIKASPQPFNVINLTESTTKIKYPGKRVTMGEMRKRVRNILEFVSRLQIESVERERRMRFLGISRDASSSESTNASSPSTGEVGGIRKQEAVAAADAAREKESETADGVAPGATAVDEEREESKAVVEAKTEGKSGVEEGEGDDVSMQDASAAANTEADKTEEPTTAEDSVTVQVQASTESGESTAVPTSATQTPQMSSGLAAFTKLAGASSMELVDELTRDLLAFQNRFGTGTSLAALSSSMGY